MSNSSTSIIKSILLLFVILNVSACSSIAGVTNKVKEMVTGEKATARHENNKSVKDLEVPPDLTAPEYDRSFELPTGVVSVASMNNATSAPTYTSTSSVQAPAAAKPVTRLGDLSTIQKQGGGTYLQINDRYERALVMTEIILTRMQFKVVNKVSATGEINVNYLGNNPAFVRGGSYRVSVINAQGAPLVRFNKTQGEVLSSAEHARIILLMNNEFNKK